MFDLRMVQVHHALRVGNLDEAYQLVVNGDLRSHRRGKQLAAQLYERLVQRSREHLQRTQVAMAAADCQRAERLGGNQVELGELRAEVELAARQTAKAQRQRRHWIDAAQKLIDGGEYTLGVGFLEKLDNSDDAKQALQEHVEKQQALARKIAERLQMALAAGRLDQAVRLCEQIAATQDTQLAALQSETVARVVAVVRESLERGALDDASLWLSHIRPLAQDESEPALRGVRRAWAHCQLAVDAWRSGRYRDVVHELTCLAQDFPQASWITACIEQSQAAAEACEALARGPLHLVDVTSPPSRFSPPVPILPSSIDNRAVAEEVAAPQIIRELPDRFMLQVDGGGTCLVICRPRVTLTAVTAPDGNDEYLALQTSLVTKWATCHRMEDDYFFESEQPVEINGRSMTRKLLADGDLITLGRRCRMRFSLPSRQSVSASLDFMTPPLARRDLKKIILVDDAFCIGGNRGVHVPVPQMSSTAVLQLRDGQLVCRYDNHEDVVHIGVPYTRGNLTMRVSEWK
ncbi:MAG: hypothetical protein KDA60_05260 [Planctomycetales bacterium]|nr:hypothetical protein [Planctomycetales bacterium]